jgi:hypothetical protein
MEAQQLGNAAQVYLAEKKLIVESH